MDHVCTSDAGWRDRVAQHRDLALELLDALVQVVELALPARVT